MEFDDVALVLLVMDLGIYIYKERVDEVRNRN